MYSSREIFHHFSQRRPVSSPESWVFSSADVFSLRRALIDDAKGAIYSGAFSLAEALQSLDRRIYSWSTVKLYYSSLYFARAALHLRGVSVFYVDRHPYLYRANKAVSKVKKSGGSHKVIWEIFRNELEDSVLLSQKIGVDDPFDWIKARREEVNYSQQRFCEPGVPNHFKFVERFGVRRLLSNYLSDDDFLMTFDPDHAMLAFPIVGLRELGSKLKSRGESMISEEDVRYVCSQAFDKRGPLSDFYRVLNPLA